jgi:DNA-binding XRE family transcriptional regulator
MSPTEIRAVREGLGLSRKAFAPKLLVSESTVVRWERGDYEPRDGHLAILRRLQNSLRGVRTAADIRYDVDQQVSATIGFSEEKRVIVATLKSLGTYLTKEIREKNGSDWILEFGLNWESDSGAALSLVCEGSQDPSRPFVDFEVRASVAMDIRPRFWEDAKLTAHRHGVSVLPLTGKGRGGRQELSIRARLFTTGFNARTVAHVVGNLRSCWKGLKGFPEPKERTRRDDPSIEMQGDE